MSVQNDRGDAWHRYHTTRIQQRHCSLGGIADLIRTLCWSARRCRVESRSRVNVHTRTLSVARLSMPMSIAFNLMLRARLLFWTRTRHEKRSGAPSARLPGVCSP